MDIHIEDHHRKVKPIEIKCDICSAKFVAQHQLRQHVSKKHTRNSHNNQLIHCQKCGQIFESNNELAKHSKECIEDFVDNNRKECKFFKRGNCLKGNSCRFAHTKKESSNQRMCRNGNTCAYFMRGQCKFIHEKTLPQNPHMNSNTNSRQCRYKEECFRLFNCQFAHSQQDFYNFARRNSPPMWQRNHQSSFQSQFRM